jgi:hypothetical protein
MAEEKIDSRIETDSEFSEQVMGEIGSLREELAAIRRLLERERKFDKLMQGYRYLPSDVENPIRWGFIGAWGKGGSHYEVDILTTTEDKFFDHPNASDENVAAFARAFTDPNTIRIWKYLFRGGKAAREEIMKGCNLTDGELDAAVKPLLEGHFAEWMGEKLKRTSHNYVLTLISMARTAIEHRRGHD